MQGHHTRYTGYHILASRYSVLTVLRSRIPNPPQKIESLQYFVKVLLSKTVNLTPQEEEHTYFL